MTIHPAPKPKARKRVKRALQRKTQIRQRRKTPRRIQGKRNPALVAWIHTQRCYRCWLMDREQQSSTECSHMPNSRRFGDERNCWALCAECHREAPNSWHNTKRAWLQRYAVQEIATDYTKRFYRETA